MKTMQKNFFNYWKKFKYEYSKFILNLLTENYKIKSTNKEVKIKRGQHCT